MVRVATVTPAMLGSVTRFLQQEQRLAGSPWADAGRDYYAWKFFGNPCGPSLAQCAYAGTELIGFLGADARRLWAAPHTSVVMHTGDSYVREEHRPSGVYLRLLWALHQACLAAGIPLSYARPSRSLIPLLQRSGAIDLARLQPWVRPLSGAWAGARLGLGPCAPVRGALNALSVLSTLPATLISGGIRIEPLSAFGRDADHLWRRARPAHGATLVKDRSYLTWRYLSGPCRYQILGARRGGELVGFVVTTGCRDRADTCELVDLLVAPEGGRFIAYRLVGEALRRARKSGFARMRCQLTGSLSHTVFTSPRTRPCSDLCVAEPLKGNQPSGGLSALISKQARIRGSKANARQAPATAASRNDADPLPYALRLHGFLVRANEAEAVPLLAAPHTVRGSPPAPLYQALAEHGWQQFRIGDTDGA